MVPFDLNAPVVVAAVQREARRVGVHDDEGRLALLDERRQVGRVRGRQGLVWFDVQEPRGDFLVACAERPQTGQRLARAVLVVDVEDAATPVISATASAARDFRDSGSPLQTWTRPG